MANPEHLERLRQGVEEWNKWREQHPTIRPDLRDTDLRGAYLRGAYLRGAYLSDANLSHADLIDADLSDADLIDADLSDANLRGANLRGANLIHANLIHANLSDANLGGAYLIHANLSDADLIRADLSYTDLRGAILIHANLSDADLIRADLSDANLSGMITYTTIFANLDLRHVKGLLEIKHLGPSRVELYSVQLPQDGSALHFLRGTGVPDEWIDFWRSTKMNVIQYHSLFISYSNKDETLARRLHTDLQAQGVRCWFAPEDMKIGDKLRPRIDQAIHIQDKLLLLLSEHAITSSWVEDEVEAALEKEEKQQREVLFPVRLDNEVMQTSQAWAAKLRRTRHIGDFTRWKEHDEYQRGLTRLLRDLKQEAIHDTIESDAHQDQKQSTSRETQSL